MKLRRTGYRIPRRLFCFPICGFSRLIDSKQAYVIGWRDQVLNIDFRSDHAISNKTVYTLSVFFCCVDRKKYDAC